MLWQWREASYTTADGDIDRVYTVCHLAVTPNIDNWLVMPHLVAEAANRVYVQVRFIMRRCASFTDSASRHHCKVRRRIDAVFLNKLFLYSVNLPK